MAAGSGHPALAAQPAIHPEKLLSHPSRAACGSVPAGHVRCLATISNNSVSNPVKASPAGTSGFGYGPVQFHTAYQMPCTPGGAVASTCTTPSSFGPETIAIVDAGNYSSSSGTLETALQSYDSYYSLPSCTTSNGCLDIVNQSGTTSPLPPNVSSGWSDEIALDVESVHMMCQTCKIVLVEANDDTVSNLSAAEVMADSYQPVAISNSWGSSSDASSYDSDFTYTGTAVVAATGDNGTDSNGQSWPADIPDVVSAAGTTLQLNTNNTWSSETVWSGSGGGCSVNYTAPSWQTARSDWSTNGCSNGGRAFGDLSADADPNTGAAVYIGNAWYSVGGTSLATPLIASMYALAADLPAGTTAPAVLYKNASSSTFHDITSGNDCTTSGQSYCTATTGFDEPSGLGSPNGVGAFQADPAPPSNFLVSFDSQTQLGLSWDAATAKNGVSGYQVYRDGTKIANTSSLSYTDSGLTPNTNYTYYLTTTDNSSNVSVITPSITAGTFLPADINEDGHVDLLDFSLLASEYGQSGPSLGRADINHDGQVNLLDFSLLASEYGQN